MVPDWLARLTAARHAPAAGVALLALGAFGQAIGQAVAAGSQPGTIFGPEAVLDGVAVCLLALAATVPLLFPRPPAATAAMTAIAAANLLLAGAFGEASVAGVIAQLIAAYQAGARRFGAGRGGDRAQYAGAVLAVPFLILALFGRGGAAAVLLAWGGPAAAGAGIGVRARREARTRTAAGEALADTMLAHSARGERARIARELHDVVAHHISMVSVQAETARLTTPGLPAAGAQRFAEIGDTARAGLTEMRRLLGVLREDAADAGGRVADRHPQPGLRQLAGLIDAARDASGTATRLIVSGPVAEFDPGVELAAYRIVQEALTNALRHAAGAAVDVELRYADDALRLRVRDNGPGPGPAWPADPARLDPARLAGGGHGLPGMRERALAVGGAVRTGPAAGGGFLVEAVLPAKPDVPVTALLERSGRMETAS